MLDPAEFRISGYDNGIHADSGGQCESIGARNREAGLKPGSLENMIERVSYSLDRQSFKAAKEIVG